MNRNSWRAEYEHFIELAASMPCNVAEAEPALQPWQDRLQALLASEVLETLEGEQRLEKLEQELRQAWMRVAHQYSDPYMKSPPLGECKHLPSGAPLEHSYERNIRPITLEARCQSYRPPPQGWQADSVLFSSGMSGLATFLQSYLAMARPVPENPLRLRMWGGYFETLVLLELLRDAAFEYRRIHAQEELFAEVMAGAADIVLLEPVNYDWDLNSLNVPRFIQSWRHCTRSRRSVIILDTTLVGHSFPVASFLKALSVAPPSLVVQVSSGLKLDQEGLELANVGILTIYFPQLHDQGTSAQQVGHYLRKVRTIVGSGLSLDEMAILDVPFFLDPTAFSRHCKAVFLNNALLAQSVDCCSGLFSRIVHPSLSDAKDWPWAQSPFVVFHLSQDDLACHGLLLAVVAYEARKRNLCLKMGSSFGFRGHRFEVIIPKLADRRGLFKVAMGAQMGPSRNGVISLFRSLAQVPDFEALRAAYPQVTPVNLCNIEE
jgi:hypothetical protein